MRPAALVVVDPPTITLSAPSPEEDMPLTSMAYKAAGSLAALKNLAVETPAALATHSFTVLPLTLVRRFARVALDGFDPLATSAPWSLIESNYEHICL